MDNFDPIPPPPPLNILRLRKYDRKIYLLSHFKFFFKLRFEKWESILYCFSFLLVIQEQEWSHSWIEWTVALTSKHLPPIFFHMNFFSSEALEELKQMELNHMHNNSQDNPASFILEKLIQLNRNGGQALKVFNARFKKELKNFRGHRNLTTFIMLFGGWRNKLWEDSRL